MKKNFLMAAVLLLAVTLMWSCSRDNMIDADISANRETDTRAVGDVYFANNLPFMADFMLWINSASSAVVNIEWRCPGIGGHYKVLRKGCGALSYTVIAEMPGSQSVRYTETYTDSRIYYGNCFEYLILWYSDAGNLSRSTTVSYNNGHDHGTNPNPGRPIIDPPFVDPGGKEIIEP